jgi:hypothetical protein
LFKAMAPSLNPPESMIDASMCRWLGSIFIT